MVSTRLISVSALSALALLLSSAMACGTQGQSAGAQAASTLERGKYLVENVGNCADCHTPFLPTGQPDRSRWLQGAPLGFVPVHPVPGWVATAPPIAGLPKGWTEEQLTAFLETGQKPGGPMAGPPMPAFRLTHEDAVAAAAYIRSLPLAEATASQ